MKQIRLQDVADQAGVSRSTASRALNSNPRISEATRLRVIQAAEDLGYRPDPVISRWAAGAWKARRSSKSGYEIAFICMDQKRAEKSKPEKILAAKQRCHELGYRLEVYDFKTLESWKRINQVLDAKSVPGVLLDTWNLAELGLDVSRRSLVCCGVGDEDLPYHTVRLDTFKQMEKVWQKGKSLNRSSVFLWLQEPQESLHGRLHYGAALECERRASTGLPIRDVCFGWESTEVLAQRIKVSGADLVISMVTNQAMEIRELLRGHGWAGDWLVLRTHPGSGFPGMLPHDNLVGIESVNLLDRHIRDFVVGLPSNPLSVLITPEWLDERPKV
ncbi:LacI family DNA-binding transcriptional regulator [Kiritimatiellota bacterium B12222]|nr:LacI family DNA-binding transcriptional regulator [Kiritimatiellota bacterium B12222]